MREEIARIIFESDWPGSAWGETGLEDKYRKIADKILARLHWLNVLPR